MEKELFDFVSEKADILSKAETAKQETKDAAIAWKQAVESDGSDAAVEAATDKLLDFLEGRPTPIDGLVAFLQGPAKELFGEEGAANALAAQQERKAAGAKWCNCEACAAASELLAKFGRAEL